LFEEEFLQFMELKHKNILNTLKEGKLTEESEKLLTDIALEIVERIK
jgi:F-type H+-transporting ATPase subunit alpha